MTADNRVACRVNWSRPSQSTKGASDDDRLRQRLSMKAAKKGPKGLDLAPYRSAMDNAVDTDELVDYRGVYDYAQGIEEAVDSIATSPGS